MHLINHLRNLQQRHYDLQQLINTEFLHFQDDTKIRHLKKQKLMLKEKILSLYSNSTKD